MRNLIVSSSVLIIIVSISACGSAAEADTKNRLARQAREELNKRLREDGKKHKYEEFYLTTFQDVANLTNEQIDDLADEEVNDVCDDYCEKFSDCVYYVCSADYGPVGFMPSVFRNQCLENHCESGRFREWLKSRKRYVGCHYYLDARHQPSCRAMLAGVCGAEDRITCTDASGSLTNADILKK